MLLKSNVVKQLSSIMIHISHSCWRHVMMRPLMSDRLLCMALVFVQSLVDLCSSLWLVVLLDSLYNNKSEKTVLYWVTVWYRLIIEALSRLNVVIQHPNALHWDINNIMAYDNVLFFVLGKIWQFHCDSIDSAQVFTYFLCS